MATSNVDTVTGVIGRIPILDVQPAVDCGRRPAKSVAGETFPVSATVFREGHGAVAAGVGPRRRGAPGRRLVVPDRGLVGPHRRLAPRRGYQGATRPGH